MMRYITTVPDYRAGRRDNLLINLSRRAADPGATRNTPCRVVQHGHEFIAENIMKITSKVP